jgi:hypothetical protein
VIPELAAASVATMTSRRTPAMTPCCMSLPRSIQAVSAAAVTC